MQIQAFALSDTGKVRKHNEDSFCIEPSLGLYVVCDGMGGHAAGEVASKTAINAIVRVVHDKRALLSAFDGSAAALQGLSDLLHEAVNEASRTVHSVASSDRGKHGMGTTCIALLIAGDKAIMANVGDSRLYMARDHQLHQLSTDHNFITEVVASGVMSAEQAAQAPHANTLTRAVGPQPTVRVDLLAFDLLPGDTFLLCSDGLYDYSREPRELLATLEQKDAAGIVRTLVNRALEGGAHDNATAVLVRADSQDSRQRERKQAVTQNLEALREIELFREFTMAELVAVYNALRSTVFESGEQPVREGDRGEHLFVIVEGRCQVARQGSNVATLGPGAHFGEMALLNQRPRSATVTALERTRLLRLDRTTFHALMAREPGIACKFLWKFAQTLSLRLDDAYLARDYRSGRTTLGIGEYPSPFESQPPIVPARR
jgi:serine/threonine protein phosphatase PrpC